MKSCKKITGVVILTLIFFSTSLIWKNAEAKWWNKGVDVLKTINSKTDVSGSTQPGMDEIAKAFKEALSIGSKNVVNKLGTTDGFNKDPAIHIPLPEKLNTVKTMLSKFGMSQMTDDLELKLNRAAEAATPKAKKLFLQSIQEMSFEDVKKIYNGPKDSATKYFQKTMTPSLSKEMSPIVKNSLSEVGAVQSYDNVMGKYKALPFVPDVKANLTAYVVQRGMDGIFHYIAKEEAAIRENPVRQTTALLKKVFGAR